MLLVVNFLVSWSYGHSGVVSSMDNLTDGDRSDLINVSRLFGCHYLETVFVNVRNDEEFLNPSIGTFLNDEMGSLMKKYFLNSSTYADIIFKVQGLLWTWLIFVAVRATASLEAVGDQWRYALVVVQAWDDDDDDDDDDVLLSVCLYASSSAMV